MDDELPIFLKRLGVKKILEEVIVAVPEGAKLYLHGGALRNALYYRFFSEDFTQRDFDLILIGPREPFVSNLIAKGFSFGSKNSDQAVVLKKPKVSNPREDYEDWVYLDLVIRPNATIEEVLKKKVNFTINGNALELKEINSADWFAKVISLPGARDDLKNKQLRVNVAYPINLYACLRFVSRGFKVPTSSELAVMIADIKNMDFEKFEKNRKKVIEYIGSEEGVLGVAREMGVNFNVLDFEVIKKAGL